MTSRKARNRKKSSQGSSEEFRRAVALQGEGQISEARSVYRRILRNNKDHSGALMNLGILCYAEGRNEEALDYFEQVIEKEPENADALYNMGRALMAVGDLQAAEEYFVEAIDIDPHDEMILVQYCRCCLDAGKPGAVIARIEEAPRKLRSAPELILLRGEALLRQGRFSAAGKLLEDALNDRPDWAEAFVLLAKVNFCSRDFPAALRLLKQAVLIDPGNAGYHKELGIIYAVQGERRAAQEAFREAKRIDPDLRLVVENGGVMARRSARHWDDLSLQMYLMERMRYWACRGTWRGAVNELLILNRKYAGRSCILQELAAAYQLDGEPKRARNMYRRLLERDPENLEAALQLADIELGLKDYEAALRLIRGVLERFPALNEGLVIKGLALKGLERFDEARAVLGRALERSPFARRALRGLGEILFLKGRSQEAVELLERAIRAGGSDPGFESLMVFSKACRSIGERERLRKVLEEVAERAPGSLATKVELARISLDCGLEDQAASLYGQALQIQPSDPVEGLCLAEACLFTRDTEEVCRLLRFLNRHCSGRVDYLFIEALVQLVQGRNTCDTVAWQRLWRADPTMPLQRIAFIRRVLRPRELKVLLDGLVKVKRLFAVFDEILSQIIALEEELQRTPSLEVINGGLSEK